MSASRETALAALRNWSAPGRRAVLVAAAWTAGETNISALAEAGRISRPTVYADLRSVGINPDDRPEEPMTSPAMLDGITGDGSEAEERLMREALTRFAEQAAPGTADQAGAVRLLCLPDMLRWYNNQRRNLQEERVARQERDRLLHLVEVRWEALSTAAAWHAAHHAYVLAVDDARIAMDMWEERADKAARLQAKPGEGEAERLIYEEIQAAGYPVLDVLPNNIAVTADLMRDVLEQAHARRRALASETLGQ
jgi:hypothetical protein